MRYIRQVPAALCLSAPPSLSFYHLSRSVPFISRETCLHNVLYFQLFSLHPMPVCLWNHPKTALVLLVLLIQFDSVNSWFETDISQFPDALSPNLARNPKLFVIWPHRPLLCPLHWLLYTDTGLEAHWPPHSHTEHIDSVSHPSPLMWVSKSLKKGCYYKLL